MSSFFNNNDFINITVSVPRNSFNSSVQQQQVVPDNDFQHTDFTDEGIVPSPNHLETHDSESFYNDFFGCVKKTPDGARYTGYGTDNNNTQNYRLSSTGELKRLKERSKKEYSGLKKRSPWRLVIEEEDFVTSSPVFTKPQASKGFKKSRDPDGFWRFLQRVGWTKGILPGQEYLDDLYEVARSRDDPMLLESLENFLAATVDNLLQKQADNERLDAALKHAKDKNTEIAAQIEDEMEQQVAILEEKIRGEEQRKLQQQKQEAHSQLLKAAAELNEMEQKIVALEDRLEENKTKETSIPDKFVQIQKKEQENHQLQAKLLEFQTQMSLMRTDVAAMKSEYDEQSERLQNERGTVLSCVKEQENLTRQLQMLHEANKKLHDTNDDLRSALDTKRNSSFMSDGMSPVKRAQSCAYQNTPFNNNDLHSSFRSDPGFMRYNSTMNNTDLNDTDDDSRQSIPQDEDDVIANNQQSLMAELMNAEQKYEPPLNTSQQRSTSLPASLYGDSNDNNGEQMKFTAQLEILAETNRRLGESNDDLRAALSLLSDQVRSERSSERGSETLSMRETPPGCYSAPVTPIRGHYDENARPNSTSSPRKVLLTKSGYHSLSQPSNASIDGTSRDDFSSSTNRAEGETTTSSFCTTCDGHGSKVNANGVTFCTTCNNDENDDTEILATDISFDESAPAWPLDETPAVKDNPGGHPEENQEKKDVSVQCDLPPGSNKSPRLSKDLSPLPHVHSYLTENPLEKSTQISGFETLPKEPEEEDLIKPTEVKQVEESASLDELDDLFQKLDAIPPSICETCEQARQVDETGAEQCDCTLAKRKLRDSTLLTDSDDSDGYSDQETSHFPMTKRGKPVGNDSEQYATYDDGTNTDYDDTTKFDDISKSSAFGYSYDRDRPKSLQTRALLRNIESEMSMYAHAQSDEEVDEDDMDDEELIRLVDQTTNDETVSLTDDPITVEEKVIMEPRGLAVGADSHESCESSLSGDVSGEPDDMFKLVLAGNAAVGKSSFIVRLCKNKFYSALNSTLGVDFQMKRLSVDQRTIALQLWDTAGQERFRSIAKSYFRRVDGVILLYDVTCENSFLDVRDWIESIESSSSGKVPIILCGNKVDLRQEAVKIGMPVVSREQGRALADKVGALFIETSAKEGTNIHKACKDLVRLMQKMEDGDPKKPDETITLDPNAKKKKVGCCS